MKTRALLLALPVLALVSGCRDNRASVQIQAICAAAAKTCVFPATCDTVPLGNADARSRRHDAPDALHPAREPDSATTRTRTSRTNTNDAHVEEAVIEYSGCADRQDRLRRRPAGARERHDGRRVRRHPGQRRRGPHRHSSRVSASSSRRSRSSGCAGTTTDGSRFETGEFPVTIDVISGRGGATACAGACPHAGQWPADVPVTAPRAPALTRRVPPPTLTPGAAAG